MLLNSLLLLFLLISFKGALIRSKHVLFVIRRRYKFVPDEFTLFDSAISQSQTPLTMLFSITPFTLVCASVCPEHLAIAVSFVLDVVSPVHIARFPLKNAESMFHTFMERTFVFIGFRACLLPPFALALFEAFDEVSGVRRSTLPLVGALTVRFAVLVDAGELITIREDVRPLAMLQ